jgi:hypothetical protein
MNEAEKRVAEILNGFVNDIDAPIFDNLVWAFSVMLRDKAEERRGKFDEQEFVNESWGYDRQAQDA